MLAYLRTEFTQKKTEYRHHEVLIESGMYMELQDNALHQAETTYETTH